MTTKEYAKIMFVGLHKKPVFIVCAILGIYYIITFLLHYLKIINFYTDTPSFEIFMCLFLLLSPSLITVLSVRQFISNESFSNDIKYTFTENGIAVEGQTCKAEYLWSHIIKQKEINKFLILYHTKKTGNFIDKTKLTLEQLKFIKSKVGHK
ncbi:YcxB family protein [Flavobacterium sufflavum]|nr:YcxB family protein [Flavobacterium sufflavum]